MTLYFNFLIIFIAWFEYVVVVSSNRLTLSIGKRMLNFVPPSRLVCIPVFESLKKRGVERVGRIVRNKHGNKLNRDSCERGQGIL